MFFEKLVFYAKWTVFATFNYTAMNIIIHTYTYEHPTQLMI